MANKSRVNLTLTRDHYEAARDLLAKLPTPQSVSGLVDDMLRQFVLGVGPYLEKLAEATPAERLELMKQLHSDGISAISLEYADAVRTFQEKGEKT